MQGTYVVHILVGGLAILSGFLALFTAKGGRLHKKSGMIFVVVMFTTAMTGVVMSAVLNVAPRVNVPAGLLTAYLVVTSLTAVRPRFRGWREVHIAGMLIAVGGGLFNLMVGLQTLTGPANLRAFAFSFFLFTLVGLAGAWGDLRVLRSGPPTGAFRLTRHLWRMCFALWIGVMSFFIGQAKVFPAELRKGPLLAIPVVFVLVTMLYWLWRVRFRRSLRGIVTAPLPGVAAK